MEVPKIRKADKRYSQNADNLAFRAEKLAIEYGSKELGKRILGEQLQRKVK